MYQLVSIGRSGCWYLKVRAAVCRDRDQLAEKRENSRQEEFRGRWNVLHLGWKNRSQYRLQVNSLYSRLAEGDMWNLRIEAECEPALCPSAIKTDCAPSWMSRSITSRLRDTGIPFSWGCIWSCSEFSATPDQETDFWTNIGLRVGEGHQGNWGLEHLMLEGRPADLGVFSLRKCFGRHKECRSYWHLQLPKRQWKHNYGA